MDLGDAKARVKFVLHDRDASFTQAFRCRIPGNRDPGHPLRRSGTPNEFDHGAVDRQLPARAARPDPDLEPAPPDDGVGAHVTRSPTARHPAPTATLPSDRRNRKTPAARQNPPAAHLIGRTGRRPLAPTKGAAAQTTSSDGLADDDLSRCADPPDERAGDRYRESWASRPRTFDQPACWAATSPARVPPRVSMAAVVMGW
jgi:hypothetical protein